MGNVPQGWVTFESARELTGLSVSSLFRWQRKQLITRPIEGVSRNGKPRRLILVDSLPVQAREIYWLRRYKADVAAVRQTDDVPGLGYSDLIPVSLVRHD